MFSSIYLIISHVVTAICKNIQLITNEHVSKTIHTYLKWN